MTVMKPVRETELDAFDLDLRVVPAGDAQDATAFNTAMPVTPEGGPTCPPTTNGQDLP